MRFIDGYRRRPPLLAPLPRRHRSPARFRKGVILNLGPILMEMENDPMLNLIKRAFSIDQILQSLIETPLLPLEYPPIMDYLCKALESDPLAYEKDFQESLLITEIALEGYQLCLDDAITKSIGYLEEEVQYVMKWLSRTTAVVSVGGAFLPR